MLGLSRKRVLLHKDATEHAQDPDNSLACKAAGDLEVLAGLALAMPDKLRTVDEYARNYKEQSGAVMLPMMPTLQRLNVGDTLLHTSFHVTVDEFLSHKTADAFRQASIVLRRAVHVMLMLSILLPWNLSKAGQAYQQRVESVP